MILPDAAGSAQRIVGRINFDTSQAERSLENLANTAQTQMNRIGNVVRQSLQRDLATFRIDRQLGQLSRLSESFKPFHSAVGEARVQLLSFTAAATAFVGVGLKAADTVYVLTSRYRELAGSQEAGIRLMNQVGRAAERLNQPVLTTQKSFIGLIPAVREVNGNLDRYINLSSRLATLNQDARGGLEGAIYAIREALASGGTDLVSLSERFNIPRKALRELIAETGSLEEALDQVLDRYGATTQAVQDQARSLTVLGQRLADVGQRLLARLFAGALDTARAAAEGLLHTLESLPDWFTGTAGAVLIAVGSLSALVLIVDTLTNSYIRVAGAALNFARVLQTNIIPALTQAIAATRAYVAANSANIVRGGVTVGALAGGALLGQEIVRATGRFAQGVLPGQRADQFANFDLSQAFDTVKQLLFLGINAIIDAFKPLAQTITVIVFTFNKLKNVLDIFGLAIQLLLIDVQIGFQQFLASIGRDTAAEIARLQALKGEPQFAQGNFGRREITGYTGLLGELADKTAEIALGMGEALQETDDLFTRIKIGVRDALFPVEAAVEETENAFTSLINKIRDNLYMLGQEAGDAFAARADSELAFYQEIQEFIETGDTDAVESRLRSLEREKEAIEAMLPELREHAEYSNDAAEKLAEFNARLDEIKGQLPQFADALIAAVNRGLSEANQEYTDAVNKAIKDRESSLVKLSKDTDKKILDQDKAYAKQREDLRDSELDIQKRYNDQIAKAEEQFRKRLAEIQRNYILAVTLAASLLDAAGVAAAINDRVEQIRRANEDRASASDTAAEQKKDRTDELAQERQDKLDAYAEQRADLLADAEEKRQEILNKFLEEQDIARQAYDTEVTELQDFYARRHANILAYQAEELRLQQEHNLKMLLERAKAFINPIAQSGVIPLISGLVNGAAQQSGSIFNQLTPNAAGIGQVSFNITSPHDPEEIANTVNRHLVELSRRVTQ